MLLVTGGFILSFIHIIIMLSCGWRNEWINESTNWLIIEELPYFFSDMNCSSKLIIKRRTFIFSKMNFRSTLTHKNARFFIIIVKIFALG